MFETLVSRTTAHTQANSSLVLARLLGRSFFFFFRILLKLVADEGIDERDNEVEDHGSDAPLPDCLDEGLLFGIQFLLSLEQSFLLLLNCSVDAFSQRWRETLNEAYDTRHDVL